MDGRSTTTRATGQTPVDVEDDWSGYDDGYNDHTWHDEDEEFSAAEERLREEERGTFNFLKKMAKNQVDVGRGVLIENPWGSALCKRSVLANLAGFQPKQRPDQCAYGAVDEKGKPTQKATGLQANISP